MGLPTRRHPASPRSCGPARGVIRRRLLSRPLPRRLHGGQHLLQANNGLLELVPVLTNIVERARKAEIQDESIRTGFTEMGQGLFTICIQFAVEATGLPPAVFSKVSADTKLMLDCGQTTASRATVLAGNSIAAPFGRIDVVCHGVQAPSQPPVASL